MNFEFSIKEVIVANKDQISVAVAVIFLISDFAIKEVRMVKHLDFADWPFPESAAVKLKQFQNMISRAWHYYDRLCQI